MSLKGITIAMLICLLSGCNSSVPTPRPDILIASDFPASGQPHHITPLQNAIQLAIDQNPRIRGYRLSYVRFDDSLGGAAWPERGLQNLKVMFADARVLGMIGPHNSYMALEEIPRASAENLVMLSGSITNPCLTVVPLCGADLESARNSAPNNFFRIAPPDPLQGSAMARFATQLHITRVAAINMWIGPPFGNGEPDIDEFGRELSATGGEMVLRGDVPRPQHDFTGFLDQAKRAGAEAIYAVGDVGGGICDIRAQMRLDFKYLLLTDGATGDDDCLKGADSPPMTFGTYGAVDPTHSADPAVLKIVTEFRKAYPQAPINDLFAFAAYDCARILIAAIERAIDAKGGGVPTRLEVLQQVASGDFTGGTTGSYSFLPSGDARAPTMSIWGVNADVNGDQHWYYMHRSTPAHQLRTSRLSVVSYLRRRSSIGRAAVL
jgi:branched-chain amino acid transport system substrate-binding protein